MNEQSYGNSSYIISFSDTIINVPKSIKYTGMSFEISEAQNNIPHSNFTTCEKLFKVYKKNLKQNEYSIALDNNLKFYFRFKLERIFDNLSYTYNIERDNQNLLSYVIPFNHDIEKNTYRAILEKKNSNGIYKNIQFSSYPLYPEFNYEFGYIIFYQKNIEITNELKNIDPNDEFYLSFIRYEGSFSVVTTESGSESGTGSSANLTNWSDASFNNVDISNLLSLYNNFNFSDLSDNNVANVSQIKQLAKDNLTNWSDASFNNVDISNLLSLYNNFNFSDLSDNNVANVSQIKQLAEDNFFFFFKSKPWPPVYLDGIYNIPYSYFYGNIFNSMNISSEYLFKNNLKLFFKIPNRREIIWNYNDRNINHVPEYNTLVIEYRNNSDILDFIELYTISNFYTPNPNDYKSDVSMTFNLEFKINRAIRINPDPIINISIDDLSVNIIINSFDTFKQSIGYQFRIYLTNGSDFSTSLTPGYIDNQYYQQDPLWNYLYFPDISNEYLITLSKGNPNPPTNINLNAINYQSIQIILYNSNQYVDDNFTLGLDFNNVLLVYNLEIFANETTNYRRNKSITSYIIDLSHENLNSTEISINLNENIYPEIIYSLKPDSYYIYYKGDQDASSSYFNSDAYAITPIPINNFLYEELSQGDINNNTQSLLSILRDNTLNYNLLTKYDTTNEIIFTDQTLNFNFNYSNSMTKVGDMRIDNPNDIDISLGNELIDISLQKFTFKIKNTDTSSTFNKELDIQIPNFNNTFLYAETNDPLFDGSINILIKDTFPTSNKSHYYLKADLYFNFDFILEPPNSINFYNSIEVGFIQYNYINTNQNSLPEYSFNPNAPGSYIHRIPTSDNVSYRTTEESFIPTITKLSDWGVTYTFSHADPNIRNYNIRSFTVSEKWDYNLEVIFNIGSITNIRNTNVSNNNLIRKQFVFPDTKWNNRDWEINYSFTNNSTGDIQNAVSYDINNTSLQTFIINNNYDSKFLQNFTANINVIYIDNLFSSQFILNKTVFLTNSSNYNFNYDGWAEYVENGDSTILDAINLQANPYKSNEHFVTFDSANNTFSTIQTFDHNTMDLKNNQLMYGENNKFTAGNNISVYKSYKFPNNFDQYGMLEDGPTDRNYLSKINTGDNINFNISANNYFWQSTSTTTNINGTYKWLSFSINSGTNNTLKINSPNTSNILYYLIFKTNGTTISSIGNGNIRQRDIGTYYIPDTNTNFNIWIPSNGYVSLNSDTNPRYLSIPKFISDSNSSTIYLIIGLLNNSGMSFSHVDYELTDDYKFGKAKTPNIGYFTYTTTNTTNELQFSGGNNNNYSNINDTLPWTGSNFTGGITTNYNFTYNLILQWTKDITNYIRATPGDNGGTQSYSSDQKVFTINLPDTNITNIYPEYTYTISNYTMTYDEDPSSYRSTVVSNISTTITIPNRPTNTNKTIADTNLTVENNLNDNTSNKTSINTKAGLIDFVSSNLTLTITYNRDNLKIFRESNGNELKGTDLYNKELNKVAIEINGSPKTIFDYFTIGTTWTNPTISHTGLSSSRFIISDAAASGSFNSHYYLKGNLNVNYTHSVSKTNNEYNRNNSISLKFYYYNNNQENYYSTNVYNENFTNRIFQKIGMSDVTFTNKTINLTPSPTDNFGITFTRQPQSSSQKVYNIYPFTQSTNFQITVNFSAYVKIDGIAQDTYRINAPSPNNDYTFNYTLKYSGGNDILSDSKADNDNKTSFTIANMTTSPITVDFGTTKTFNFSVGGTYYKNIGYINASIPQYSNNSNDYNDNISFNTQNASFTNSISSTYDITPISSSKLITPNSSFNFYVNSKPNVINTTSGISTYLHNNDLHYGQCMYFDGAFRPGGHSCYRKYSFPISDGLQSNTTNSKIDIENVDYSTISSSGFSISNSDLNPNSGYNSYYWYDNNKLNVISTTNLGTFKFIIKKLIFGDVDEPYRVLTFSDFNFYNSKDDLIFLINVDNYWLDATFQRDSNANNGISIGDFITVNIGSNKGMSCAAKSNNLSTGPLKIRLPFLISQLPNYDNNNRSGFIYFAIGVKNETSIPPKAFNFTTSNVEDY